MLVFRPGSRMAAEMARLRVLVSWQKMAKGVGGLYSVITEEDGGVWACGFSQTGQACVGQSL